MGIENINRSGVWGDELRGFGQSYECAVSPTPLHAGKHRGFVLPSNLGEGAFLKLGKLHLSPLGFKA